MCECTIAAAVRGDAKDTHHALMRSPLDKYTPRIDLPRIQDAILAALITNIDLAVLDVWFNNKGIKALIIPFEDKACDPDLQSNIVYKLLTAIEEITISQC